MYSVIGHEEVRRRLQTEQQSFFIFGPQGVGRKGILHEWAQDRMVEWVPKFDVATAKNLAVRSYTSRDLFFAIDADTGTEKSWLPLLKPLEERHLKIAAITDAFLPEPVLSRLSMYTVGELSEVEILRILARDFSRLTPRPLIAKACHGSLSDVKSVASMVSTFEGLNKALADKKVPFAVRTNPLPLYSCLWYACFAVMKCGKVLPFSDSALQMIPHHMAEDFVGAPYPIGKNEARNKLNLFFARAYRG